MDPVKEEVHYITDTPVRIAYDDQISIFRGKLPPHWHEEIEIDFVIKGSVYYIVNGTTYHVLQGEVIVIDSNVIHSGRCSDGNTVEETRAEVLTIQINESVFKYANYQTPSFQVHISNSESVEVRSIMMDILTIYQQKKPYYEMLINSHCLKLCYCLLAKHSSESKTMAESSKINNEIKRAIQYIEDHFGEPLTLQHMTVLTNYNTSYFSRVFHQYTGFTFVEYLNRCRAKVAARMLVESDKSVSDISYESGFPNISSFITFFKREYNTTPEKYRRSNTKK